MTQPRAPQFRKGDLVRVRGSLSLGAQHNDLLGKKEVYGLVSELTRSLRDERLVGVQVLLPINFKGHSFCGGLKDEAEGRGWYFYMSEIERIYRPRRTASPRPLTRRKLAHGAT